MAWKTNILVVANVTADSDELLTALSECAARGPTSFELIVPPRGVGEGSRQAAQERLDEALARARERGLEIDGRLADSDPVVAVTEAFDPRRFDEIIVSTLPVGVSRWLQVDLPHRLERITGVPVRHVLGREPRPPARSMFRAPPERRGVLAALMPLSWSRRGEAPERRGAGPAHDPDRPEARAAAATGWSRAPDAAGWSPPTSDARRVWRRRASRRASAT
jgi:hypothetical protein